MKKMSEFEYPYCEVCANELRLFIDATKVARGYEVCDNCYYDLGV